MIKKIKKAQEDISDELLDSLEMLGSLQEEGLKIVPVVPTLAMVKAGAQVSGLSEDVVQELYEMMLNFSDESFPAQMN